MTIKVSIENGVLEQKLNKAIKEMPKSERPNPFNETTAKRKLIEQAIEYYIELNYSGLGIFEKEQMEAFAEYKALERRDKQRSFI